MPQLKSFHIEFPFSLRIEEAMTRPFPKITLGLLQMRCEKEAALNLGRTLDKMREAAQKGAQIISTQELFLSPYFCQTNNKRFFELAEAVPGPTSDAFSKIARELGVVIVASLFEKDGNDYYNTACVLDADGKFLGKYRKMHIPDDLSNYYSEMFYFKPGNLGFPIFKTRFGTIGVQVCWDQWYPEGARSLALQGAEIIFYPTAIGWPLAQREQEIGSAEYDAWLTIQRGHSIANTVFVAATNRIGTEDHLNFWGASFVSDPLGRVLAKASHNKEEILYATCDFSEIEKVRKDWPFLSCRRPKAYPDYD